MQYTNKNDVNCDLVVTEDCDDNNSTLLAQSNDIDCDGVLQNEDCDDNDYLIGSK